MKTTTTRITAVALATAALCWHQASHAAATESQLRTVTLYGNVSIQEDSTGSWGPWAEFEPTAAGANQPVTAPPVSTTPYRPLAQTTGTPPPLAPIEGACVGGSICGFGAFMAGDLNAQTEGEGKKKASPDLNPFRLNGTVVEAANAESLSPLLPPVIQLTSTVLSSTGTFQLPVSGSLDLISGDGFQYSRHVFDESERPVESYVISPDYASTGGYSPEEVQAINFNLTTYVRGKGQSGWGVIGYTTSTADMSALRASNAQASYSGNDYYGTPVSMSVNFGNATWSGSWNGGVDGEVSSQVAASGGNILTGAVGFTAAGTVVGSTFSSNTVGTNTERATVTGSVQGAFFGPNAAAAGGVVDITKTVQAAQQQPARAAAQAVNANQGYTGRYVAPFIVTRGGNDRRE